MMVVGLIIYSVLITLAYIAQGIRHCRYRCTIKNKLGEILLAKDKK